MDNLFDRLNENFFSPLSSPNKRVYIDCIFIMYRCLDSLEDGFQGDRDFIIGKLTDYFDDCPFYTDEDESIRTSRQKAVAVLNTLRRCGWIGEEELGDYKVSLNFFDYSIKIIDILDGIMTNRQLEYTGDIYAVYSLFASYDEEESLDVLEQAYQKTIDITRRLKALKANIYRYYYDITRNKESQELAQLLEKLLIEYKQNFFDAAYYNLKTKDSLPKYKRSIIGSLNQISDSEYMMDSLAKKMMSTKRIDDYDQAFLLVEEKIRYIHDSFIGLESLMASIDRKNEQYIAAAASKILFLTNHSDNIEGIFNRLFKIILENKEEDDYTDLFNLVYARNFDTNSLSTPRERKKNMSIDELVLDPSLISAEVIKNKVSLLFKNTIFNKSEIDQYVLTLLGNKNELKASETPLDCDEDYVKLILIFLYSKSLGMSYTVKKINSICDRNMIKYQDFLILRRTHE